MKPDKLCNKRMYDDLYIDEDVLKDPYMIEMSEFTDKDVRLAVVRLLTVMKHKSDITNIFYNLYPDEMKAIAIGAVRHIMEKATHTNRIMDQRDAEPGDRNLDLNL